MTPLLSSAKEENKHNPVCLEYMEGTGVECWSADKSPSATRTTLVCEKNRGEIQEGENHHHSLQLHLQWDASFQLGSMGARES